LIECLIWAERAITHLGDQHKNSRREMEIYASLSLALMHSEGSSERVREAFSRALDIATMQGDPAYELRLLSGLFMYHRWNVVPKFISPSDPAAQWTGAHKRPAFFAYSDNYLIDVKFGVIVDVEASRSIRQAEVGAAKTMIERTEERFGLKPERLVGDTA
jgi:hypothetical protein